MQYLQWNTFHHLKLIYNLLTYLFPIGHFISWCHFIRVCSAIGSFGPKQQPIPYQKTLLALKYKTIVGIVNLNSVILNRLKKHIFKNSCGNKIKLKKLEKRSKMKQFIQPFIVVLHLFILSVFILWLFIFIISTRIYSCICHFWVSIYSLLHASTSNSAFFSVSSSRLLLGLLFSF